MFLEAYRGNVPPLFCVLLVSNHGPATLLTPFQGKYEEAEPLYERCQAIMEKVLGPEHPSLATTLNNRAALFYAQVRI